MKFRTLLASAACCAGLIVARPSIVRAQQPSGSDVATRRDLLDQAQRARSANDHARALDLATRAGRISMTPSLRLFIAEEQNALGRFADALGNADLCVRETERDQTARNRDQILSSCRQILEQARSHVGRVTVQVPETRPPGLHVTVNGAELSDALFGVAYSVNPGRVVVEARGEGIQPFRTEVDVIAGQMSMVDVTLTPAPGTGAGAGTGTGTGSGSGAGAGTGSGTGSGSGTGTGTGAGAGSGTGTGAGTGSGTGSGSGSGTGSGGGTGSGSGTGSGGTASRGGISPVPIVLMGVGGAGLLGGLITGLIRNGALRTFQLNHCEMGMPTFCNDTQEARDEYAGVIGVNTVANALFIGGAAVLAVGTVWLIVGAVTSGGPSSQTDRRARWVPSVVPAPVPGGAMLTVGGAL